MSFSWQAADFWNFRFSPDGLSLPHSNRSASSSKARFLIRRLAGVV